MFKNRKQEFTAGLFLMIGFLVVLVILFMPLFDGKNSMQYLDNLYNSISKGSAYYIPELDDSAKTLEGEMVDTQLVFESAVRAEQSAALFVKNGLEASVSGENLDVKGDLGVLYHAALADAELLYRNNDQALEEKYGYDGRAVLYNWWLTSNKLDKALSKEKRYELSKVIGSIKNKGIEASYNYFGIEPERILDKIVIVIASLLFYVVYTLWYGFAILFMFEGAGFRLEH
jgi:hypothetical protein